MSEGEIEMSVSDVLASALSTGDNEVQVSLSTTAGPEELWSYWEDLADVSKHAGELVIGIGDQWRNADDPVLRGRLWIEYESASSQFEVLNAWKNVIHAAYVFMTEGADLVAFENGTPTPF